MPCGIAAGWSATNAAADHVACAFLCSAQAGYITGQNLLIDGGVQRRVLGLESVAAGALFG